MKATIMSTTKWLSIESPENAETFNFCDNLKIGAHCLTSYIVEVQSKWELESGKPSGKDYICNTSNIQDLQKIQTSLSKIVKTYYRINPKLARLSHDPHDNIILQTKVTFTMEALFMKRFLLLYSVHTLIVCILKHCMNREDKRRLMEICFSLITLFNELSTLSSKSFVSKFNVCSNTCPNLIYQMKKISMTKVIQMIAQGRSLPNCHRLIDCLLLNYKPHSQQERDDSSDTSSLEIYQALTKHMTPPLQNQPQTLHKSKSILSGKKPPHSPEDMEKEKKIVDIKNEINRKNDTTYTSSTYDQTSDSEIPYSSMNENYDYEDGMSLNVGLSSLYKMLQYEDTYLEVLLDTAVRISPSLLGNDGTKKLQSGETRITKRAVLRVVEHYHNILWGEVGCYLEHIVLWWSSSPLASRPPQSSQNLRDWLTNLNKKETPPLILTTLSTLAEALGCHVTSTSWDKLFGLTLVTNLELTQLKDINISTHLPYCSSTGANFAVMLQELVTLNNQCEVTGDYIMGAPVDELPLVEQIPILHRLDHSIHTCRLWTLAETRKLANHWDMDRFFRILQKDIQACLEQLTNLRFADHTQAIEDGKIGVHEHVCAKMREKLVSEIKVNIQKLKQAPEECIQVLAAVCATTSLAHLTMIFPTNFDWRNVHHPPVPGFSTYVYNYLDRVLLPVIKATDDKIITNMVLRIMCESWLNHIYVSKVKFSNAAATQLLSDFETVKLWLEDCKILSDTLKKQMLNNEVLRRCEGVGRLLLHSPGDPISMIDSTTQQKNKRPKKVKEEPTEEIMPAEMYVPNQQQWLTLRARRGPLPHFCMPICCSGCIC